jgi:hypothetical protein
MKNLAESRCFQRTTKRDTASGINSDSTTCNLCLNGLRICCKPQPSNKTLHRLLIFFGCGVLHSEVPSLWHTTVLGKLHELFTDPWHRFEGKSLLLNSTTSCLHVNRQLLKTILIIYYLNCSVGIVANY